MDYTHNIAEIRKIEKKENNFFPFEFFRGVVFALCNLIIIFMVDILTKYSQCSGFFFMWFFCWFDWNQQDEGNYGNPFYIDNLG